MSCDEAASKARDDELAAAGQDELIHASIKGVVEDWVRETSFTHEWAGAGIPPNAVGPGAVLSPMTEHMLATDEGRAALIAVVPVPCAAPRSQSS